MEEDIVARIRNRIHDAPMPTERLLDEAADYIEQLRGTLAEMRELAGLMPVYGSTPVEE